MKYSFTNIVITAMAILTKLLYLTLRTNIDPNTLKALEKKSSSALFCWHGGFAMLPYINTYYRKNLIVGLVSGSRDGGYLAKFLSFFHVVSERGSSSKNGGKAAINLIRTLRNGGSICITPDGPKGPINKAKEGMITVMEKSPNSRLIFVKIKYEKFWGFNSWDKFCIPKPFSKIEITGHEYLNIESLKEDAKKEGVSYISHCETLLG